MLLLFSCGENEGKINKENTTTHSSIEEEGGKVYVRNISEDKKYEFTLSIYIENCSSKISGRVESIRYIEEQEKIVLNPGEKQRAGSLCEYSWEFNEGSGFLSGSVDYRCINDSSKITYAIVGELEIE